MKVSLIHREGRPYIEARWIDPITGKKRTRSTGTKLRREAERFAARLEKELDAAGGQRPGRITWAAFVARYEADVLSQLERSTRLKSLRALRLAHESMQVQFIDAITAAMLAEFVTSLQSRTVASRTKDGVTERPISAMTIHTLAQKVKQALAWASEMDLLAAPPKLRLPKRIAKPRGRAITGEEFDRMLEACHQVVPAEAVESWQRLLQGLWWSGLRLSEAMRLHWTKADTGIVVDMSGLYVMLKIWPDGQKSRKYQVLPVSGEFANFLKQTPESERTGPVFKIHWSRRSYDLLIGLDYASKVICKIGKAANVKVSATKTASAHDLRRSFGTRLARQVTMPQLRELMRHTSIETTAKYYLTLDAEETAKAVQEPPAQLGNTFGNSRSEKISQHHENP
jgi:integrase